MDGKTTFDTGGEQVEALAALARARYVVDQLPLIQEIDQGRTSGQTELAEAQLSILLSTIVPFERVQEMIAVWREGASLGAIIIEAVGVLRAAPASGDEVDRLRALRAELFPPAWRRSEPSSLREQLSRFPELLASVQAWLAALDSMPSSSAGRRALLFEGLTAAVGERRTARQRAVASVRAAVELPETESDTVFEHQLRRSCEQLLVQVRELGLVPSEVPALSWFNVIQCTVAAQGAEQTMEQAKRVAEMMGDQSPLRHGMDMMLNYCKTREQMIDALRPDLSRRQSLYRLVSQVEMDVLGCPVMPAFVDTGPKATKVVKSAVMLDGMRKMVALRDREVSRDDSYCLFALLLFGQFHRAVAETAVRGEYDRVVAALVPMRAGGASGAQLLDQAVGCVHLLYQAHVGKMTSREVRAGDPAAQLTLRECVTLGKNILNAGGDLMQRQIALPDAKQIERAFQDVSTLPALAPRLRWLAVTANAEVMAEQIKSLAAAEQLPLMYEAS